MSLNAQLLTKRIQSAITGPIAEHLARTGWAAVDGLFGSPGVTSALRSEIVSLYRVQGGKTVLVEKSHIHEAELTLDKKMSALAPLCEHLNQDRTLATMLSLLVPRLRLDTQAIKLQYNSGSGGCFPLHLDTDALIDGRKVTAIFYLNPKWEVSHGGYMKLYPWPCPPVSLAPKNDRLVLFSSPAMLHRVTPSHAPTQNTTAITQAKDYATGQADPSTSPTHAGQDSPSPSPTHEDESDASRCCFTIWLSQERGRRPPPPRPSLSALMPQQSPQQDPDAAARFLLQPYVRPHVMKMVYADEWETSLRESHPACPEVESMIQRHRDEVGVIRKALGRFEGVIERMTSDQDYAQQMGKHIQWF